MEQTEQPSAQPIQQEIVSDSIKQLRLNQTFGDFSMLFQNKKGALLTLENEKLLFEINPKGGLITSLRLKEFNNYEDQPLFLVKDNNTNFNVLLKAQNGIELNTAEMYFSSKNGYTQVIEKRTCA